MAFGARLNVAEVFDTASSLIVLVDAAGTISLFE